MRTPLRVDPARWLESPLFWLEWFLISNLAFLAVDIAIAHAANAFEHRAEWIPIGFSLLATALLLAAQVISGRHSGLARCICLVVGWGSVAVGIAGLLWHLDSDFFQRQTLKNLVYTAPFVAPLAYTGLGLLLLMIRMVDPHSEEWWRWVLLLAAAGFAGNFVLSLADHAQNGFFYVSEWTGVVAGAVGFGFLMAGVMVPGSRGILIVNAAIMAIQVVVGLVGFYLHAAANLLDRTGPLWDRFVYGTPVFAPLLFADLALLGLLGLWAQVREMRQSSTV